MLRRVLCFSAVLILAAFTAKTASAADPLYFKVTGVVSYSTAAADAQAFSVGESVTFSFELVEGLGAPNVALSSYLSWQYDNMTYFIPIFQEVVISGATGSPNINAAGAISAQPPSNGIEIGLGSWDGVASFGMSRNGIGLSNIYGTFVQVPSLLVSPSPGPAATSPESVFEMGTLYVGAGTMDFSVIDENGARYNLWGAELTIVPEPTTVGLAAIGILGLVSRRRTIRCRAD